MADRLHALTLAQAAASHPQADVWLAASAGTGKTQVLAARVLRLLLNGARPETILCLTFTKGGAAEMAERVQGRLAAWVRAPDKDIRFDLSSLGEPNGEAQIATARTLFATVLDARGGGLRIQTIHSFCQTLLGAFPAEAGLTPGFRPLEEREAKALAQRVLADLVSSASSSGEAGFVERLQALAHDKGEDGARAYLAICAGVSRTLVTLGPGIAAHVRAALGLHNLDVEAHVCEQCDHHMVDTEALMQMIALNESWGKTRGKDRAQKIRDWLALDAQNRAEKLIQLTAAWTKADGEHFGVSKNWTPQSPEYGALSEKLFTYFNGLAELRKIDLSATRIADALLLGQRYALAFTDAKRAAGAVDFDDLIHITAQLLEKPGIGDWIRYKLDQSTDHILVDEAQDTNASQWAIIQALAGEFYPGSGQKGAKLRTIFTVGDTKQAIFAFQGTDPQAMRNARDWFDAKALGMKRDLLKLDLAQSYRSSPPILAFVDKVIALVGATEMGLVDHPPRHSSARGIAGQVVLLPLVRAKDDREDSGEENWMPPVNRLLARKIAEHVAFSLKSLTLEKPGKAEARLLEPKDVMILLRSRGELAQLLVARLHEVGVPVAGIDRLRLNTPLVVRDVLAAVRFALQPHDDLNLACLLVSPLIGWTQEQLQLLAIARDKRTLWGQLRAVGDVVTVEMLRNILNAGDRLSPSQFIEDLLSGSLRGRYKLIERFGAEVRDPLEELINAARSFAQRQVATLQGFLDWFEQGDIDIKREPTSNENAVRVLTVHAAKGLQSPLVILADAAFDPRRKSETILNWPLTPDLTVPIPRPNKADQLGAIAEAAAVTEQQMMAEHWRLLYVALTRAEQRLVIAGVQGARALSADCWYLKAAEALAMMHCEPAEDGSIVYGIEVSSRHARRSKAISGSVVMPSPTRPAWLDVHAPAESRPPRPLAPSALLNDRTAYPPQSSSQFASRVRGRLLHALFERLPAVPPNERIKAADVWLTCSAGVSDAEERRTLINDALQIIDDPANAEIFSSDALAEAPIAGVVEGIVISGTVDRLVIKATTVRVIDFKTARRAPSSVAAIPETHLRQMAAYVAVLQNIFSNHEVSAALLYTSSPKIFILDAITLAPHKPSFQLEQQVLAMPA